MYLPDQNHITRIDDHDPLPYYFSPWTGWIYRARLKAALTLLDERPPAGQWLEIGYGSGILLPELARRCSRLAALDSHRRGTMVQTMLAREGLRVPLMVGDIVALPLASASCSTLICLSVMEHLTARALEAAARETARILRPGGTAVVGFPVRNLLSDTFFRLVGLLPRDIHPSSHRDIAALLERYLRIEAWATFPAGAPRPLAAYWVCCARPLE